MNDLLRIATQRFMDGEIEWTEYRNKVVIAIAGASEDEVNDIAGLCLELLTEKAN